MHLILDFLWFAVFATYCYIEALVKCFIPVKRKSVAGEIVLVTGAASGIGRLIAFEFAKQRSRLVLWDINKSGIKETAEDCRKLGVEAYPYVVDCSLRGNLQCCIFFSFWSYVKPSLQTIKAFLPAMMKNNHGHIVSVASFGGLVSTPFLVSYCSSKFANLGLHKGFTKELSTLGKDGIKTTCLCPCFISTPLVENPRSRIIPVLKPEAVAKRLMDGILCNQKQIIMPSPLAMFSLVEIILPERALVAFEKIVTFTLDMTKQE
uniref:Estradiol 17-beta-dehydrogenase 11 n=1 Tax=Naja naja TaxID=35670 RepID=A0A8C6X5D5_NAJNA